MSVAPKDRPAIVEIKLRETDVEAVIREYQAANPGNAACDMTPAEFADRMLKKIIATATLIEGGNA